MSLDPAIARARTHYPVLARARERHLGWARDFAIAGDADSAVDAIRDACAILGELRTSDFTDDAR